MDTKSIKTEKILLSYNNFALTPYIITAPPLVDYGPKRKVYGRLVDVRTDPKIGRNQLCPCGSLKKFKKCCMP